MKQEKRVISPFISSSVSEIQCTTPGYSCVIIYQPICQFFWDLNMPCQLSNKSELPGVKGIANKMIQIMPLSLSSLTKQKHVQLKSYMKDDSAGTSHLNSELQFSSFTANLVIFSQITIVEEFSHSHLWKHLGIWTVFCTETHLFSIKHSWVALNISKVFLC